tara:strand:- start:1450 stop:1710 length:261 start_codon:yes stop_codon:yes gene_type:complete
MTGIVTPKRTVLAQVTKRVQDCLCLVCDSESERRGLCFRHYQMYRRRLDEKPKGERADFEVTQIREGRVLPPHAMGRIKRENPFEE